MTTESVHLALERVFREVFEDEPFTFSSELSRETLKAWDSLGHIRLVAAVEEAFEVHFTIEQIEKLTSVAKIAAELSALS